MKRLFPLFALASASAALAGCPQPPPITIQVTGEVHIIEADEDGDEWMHEKCFYKGTINASSDVDARLQAIARKANIVEPLSKSTRTSSNTNNGFTSSTSFSATTCKIFFCKKLPEGI